MASWWAKAPNLLLPLRSPTPLMVDAHAATRGAPCKLSAAYAG